MRVLSNIDMHFNKDQILIERAAANIRLLILDVDGVLTDGRLYFSNAGEELKAFHTLDGYGIKMLQKAGIEVGIVTGRISKIVEHRGNNLGINLLMQGREDKIQAVKEILSTRSFSLNQAAYAGDDLPDLQAIKEVGLGCSVPNAHSDVIANADIVTTRAGGSGAVREIADFLLKSQGR